MAIRLFFGYEIIPEISNANSFNNFPQGDGYLVAGYSVAGAAISLLELAPARHQASRVLAIKILE